MSQLITGNYVIKFERNSFRVQLSARGIATCFALSAAKGAGKQRCGSSLSLSEVKVKKSHSNHCWHLQVIALKTGPCWSYKLSFN